ncbi:hypothetical protein [Phenylobacterium immobile]|uniref:hypothetical protein n=1 Tax=Phenylobacterium immobile TaxID=21 RepID=UPI000A4788FE|nr:hypothetical protein [Phenylobacterium immobile]
MGSKAPPIPKEQGGGQPNIKGADIGRRDRETGLQSEQAGDGDTNLDQQGRFGNLKQNTSRSGNVQNR